MNQHLSADLARRWRWPALPDGRYSRRGMALAFLAAGLLAGCGTPFQSRERIVLTAPLPAEKLVALNHVGDVTITADPKAGEIRAEVVKIGKGSTQAEADKALAQIRTSLNSKLAGSTTVQAVSEHPQVHGFRGYEVQWQIVGPPGLAVIVDNGVGDVRVSGFGGDVRVETGVGDVAVDHIAGKAVVRSGVGDVHAADVSGDAEVRTGTGDASLRRVGGSARVTTGVGDVHVEAVTGGLKASTGTGDIHAQAAGPIDLRTGVGDVRLHLLPGEPAPVIARTGTGNLRLRLPADRKGRIVADTDVGSIRLLLDDVLMRAVRQRRHHFEADLNGQAQPAMDLSTNVGSLTIESYPAAQTTAAGP